LVTATGNTVSVLLAMDGTFQAARGLPHRKPINRGGLFGDINGDGRPICVTVDSADNSVGILLATADGTFQTHVEYVGQEAAAVK